MEVALDERFSSAHRIDPAGGFDLGKLRGKTAVITGGASGIGEASLRGLVQAGAFVAFSDISQERGDALEKELGSENVAFVQGDVTNWSDQKRLFKTAVEKSPSGCINVVFANAAIVEPTEPDMDVADIGFRGVLLTTKPLPCHHRQYRWLLGPMIKWAARGLMRSLRSSMPENEMRVNLMAPWYLRTNLISQNAWDHLEDNRGIILAEKEDAAKAVLHLASDETIHGRSIMIIPRKEAAEEYVDMDRDSHDLEVLGRERFSEK
ncbi:hypothetical protein M409DRAFT_48402 [Zasmidium cellare ATCC 36951]|uniref:Uncharacterized protein n=1 Tax=Zasmidium cellare ATCC 36951 TaxID=1080233 RepID=A0A6A6D4X2_ZASCE|nr:uncharacterized protein M409DRAFT_48402 [Zasmidium cellare ATCC 36951]KAF2173420.1 hypothetical protein M409DRAFT_48402 [Zasmidium cellare ATCC 36951]